MERRGVPRAELQRVYVNKYVEGAPHAAEILDLSEDGLRVRRIFEPESDQERYCVELVVPSPDGSARDRIWLWTRRAWRRGDEEALAICWSDALDRIRLRRFVQAATAA